MFIAHSRRELVRVSVTDSPTAAWIWQQFVEATPWGAQPSHLIHDRDAVYGKVFPAQLERIGVSSIRTPIRAPRANAVGERMVRTLRQECLDHVIVLNEHHLRQILAEFVGYYNEERPHRTLDLETPRYAPRTSHGSVVRRSVSTDFTIPTRAQPEVRIELCRPTAPDPGLLIHPVGLLAAVRPASPRRSNQRR